MVMAPTPSLSASLRIVSDSSPISSASPTAASRIFSLSNLVRSLSLGIDSSGWVDNRTLYEYVSLIIFVLSTKHKETKETK